MKKIISFALTFIIMILVLSIGSIITASANDAVFDGGNGTEEFPYIVSTSDQLCKIGNYPDSYFIQAADIDMTGVYYNTMETLNGGYDGGGHCVKGLTVSMFGENNGFIRNLGLTDTQINDKGHSFTNGYKGLQANTAALAVTNNGEINGCYSVDSFINASVSYTYSTDIVTYAFAGGLVCENKSSGVIENCYNRGTIRAYASARTNGPINTHATSRARAGGIVAYNSNGGTVRNCYSVTDVLAKASKSSYTGSEESYAGIVCAYNLETIENCYYVADYDHSPGVTSYPGVAAEATQVTDDEIKRYDMIAKLNNTSPLIYQQDIYNTNEGYPVLNTQGGTMGIVTSHEPGNYSGEFELDIKLEFPNGGTYNLYYAVLGKDEAFEPCLSPISITDKNTTVIAYVENAYNTKMRRVYKLDYKLADHPVLASHEPKLYNEPISVVLTCNEEGAEIYYTTDGSDPQNGTRYTGSIPIFKNTTILTAAKVNGEFGDAIKYEYRISPIITPSVTEGSYDSPFMMSLKSSLAPYEIYYTANGWGDPTKENEGAVKYTGEFEVYTWTKIRAAACFEGEWSEIYEFIYEFPEAEITPSLEPGEYSDVQTVSFSCNLPYADLEITDSNSNHIYKSSIEIYKTTTVNVAVTYKDQFVRSKSFTYTLPEAEIIASPASGSYNNIINVELSGNIPSYEIYYTLDGSDPNVYGMPYTDSIELDKTTTIKTAAKYGNITVVENSFNYTLDLPYVTADYESGIYNEAVEIALSSSNAFYDVYYTLDGSDPKVSGIKYSSPIKVTSSSVIRAVPVFNNTFGTSSSYKYIISSGETETPSVTANYESGNYNKTFEVELLCGSEFYDVYYTLDGSDPKTNGIKYNMPIKVTASSLIRAIPVFGNIFGEESSYEYHIFSADSKSISADNISSEKNNNGYLSIYFTIENSSPIMEPSDLYFVFYDGKGALLNVEKRNNDIQPGRVGSYTSCNIPQEMPEDGYFKIICWAKDTMYPLFASEKIYFNDTEEA